ncbi:hypothetical protein CDAR_406071 [Caerostris darwini]|uniref:Uncharacterized protein n=1 Tax=Caerostris darwini TaxID=1538125 RepID=A0AAV4RTS5_9ARAC|nr:hypothetical protein CDAR_406071 [Caerostris darwini]
MVLLFLLNFPKPHDVFMILLAKARTKKNDKSLFCATARVHHKFSSPLTWPCSAVGWGKKGICQPTFPRACICLENRIFSLLRLQTKARTKKNDKSLFCATARVHHKFSSPLAWPCSAVGWGKKGICQPTFPRASA